MKKKFKISNLDRKKDISYKFHEISKNKQLIDTQNSYPKSWIDIHFKTYPRMKMQKLPILKINRGIERILAQRKSSRNFSGKPIELNSLTKILQFSTGLIDVSNGNLNKTRRPYPSAGARYPLELYIVTLKVMGIKNGLYHFNLKENSLELLLEKKLDSEVQEIVGKEAWIEKASAIIFVTAILDRVKVKYKERGYRYALIECGHLAQNILLVTTDIGLKACPMGGFIDDMVIDLLDLKLVNEVPLYVIALGE